MADVALRIGGRNYTVSCQDGQETHIARLGRAIEAKLESLGSNARQNEPRALLFAALLLADEAHELKLRMPAAASQPYAAPAPAPAPAAVPILAPALEALADRLEKLAESLEA